MGQGPEGFSEWFHPGNADKQYTIGVPINGKLRLKIRCLSDVQESHRPIFSFPETFVRKWEHLSFFSKACNVFMYIPSPMVRQGTVCLVMRQRSLSLTVSG